MAINKQILITALGASMAGILSSSLTSGIEASLRQTGGQPTINGGRKKFKQNRRQQIKRNR